VELSCHLNLLWAEPSIELYICIENISVFAALCILVQLTYYDASIIELGARGQIVMAFLHRHPVQGFWEVFLDLLLGAIAKSEVC